MYVISGCTYLLCSRESLFWKIVKDRTLRERACCDNVEPIVHRRFAVFPRFCSKADVRFQALRYSNTEGCNWSFPTLTPLQDSTTARNWLFVKLFLLNRACKYISEPFLLRHVVQVSAATLLCVQAALLANENLPWIHSKWNFYVVWASTNFCQSISASLQVIE